MPKSKEYVSSSSEEVESSEEEKPKKRQKRERKEETDKKSSKKAKKESKEEETTTWDLGSNRQVNVREFKGQIYVDIREMYMDKNSGDFKPGKKGIMLNMSQWRKLVGMIEDVDKVAKSKC